MNSAMLAIAFLITCQEVEIRLRGPVHEAFAATGDSRAPWETPPPPQPLAESVPRVYPGAGAWWIPGYWDFDQEENTWTWVTGTWRVPPPGHAWISGYWRPNGHGGWQRVPGLWHPSGPGQARLTYLPPLTSRPPRQAPPPRPVRDDDPHIYFIPGEWQLQGTALQWQPGKRVRLAKDMAWGTGRLAWSPAGILPVPGHTDLGFENRGWGFAPVRARPGTAFEPGWTWAPRAWLESAWRDPAGTYRLGDHHAPLWTDIGLVSALDAMRHKGDPFLETLARQAATPQLLEQAQYMQRERGMGRQAPPPRQLTRENAQTQGWVQPAKGEATPDEVLKREQERGAFFEKQANARQKLEQGIKRLPATVLIESN